MSCKVLLFVLVCLCGCVLDKEGGHGVFGMIDFALLLLHTPYIHGYNGSFSFLLFVRLHGHIHTCMLR